jgi:hypothetical protein
MKKYRPATSGSEKLSFIEDRFPGSFAKVGRERDKKSSRSWSNSWRSESNSWRSERISKTLRLPKIAGVLVRLNHVARCIVNANRGVV